MRAHAVLLLVLASLAALALPSPAAGALLLPTGRPIAPVGRIVPLQAYPTGAAVSPDGNTVLAIAGPVIQGGVPAGPSGGVALKVIDAATGNVRQTLNVDDAFQGVAYDSSGKHAFVAGGAGATVHEFSVAADGTLSLQRDIKTTDFVSGLAISRDARTLWAAEPTAGVVEEFRLAGGEVRRRIRARSPDRLALSADGKTLYASDWRGSCLTAIALRTARGRCVHVGAQPTGVATARGTVLTSDSGDATVAIAGRRGRSSRRLSLALVGRRTDAPNDVVLAPDGQTAYVSLGGDDAVAVLRRSPTRTKRRGRHHVKLARRSCPRHPRRHAPRRRRRRRSCGKAPWRLAGLIPTGWYPTALALSPDGRQLHVVTVRGVGHSAAATAPLIDPDPASVIPDGAYGTAGTLETITLPDRAGLATYTAAVRAYLRAWRLSGDPANPLIAGRAGPIKHVIYITRENKTYDADLGDLHPGPGNALAIFGAPITPNLHALERSFVEAQSFYYQGFASTVGHMWEDAGAVSDLYEHTQAAKTGAHTSHVSDSWSHRSNYPSTGTLAEQVWHAGLSVRTYNEETVQQAHLLPSSLQAPTSLFPNYDLRISDTTREAGWEREFRQFEAHRCTGSLAATYRTHCSLPDFEYVYLGEDHTTVVDEPGYPTIQAQVADNDYATGKLIDAVSHSPDWRSTLIIVLDDDPQGTGDHISPYRGFVAVASPYVRRGLITTTHYDLTSAVAAIDRILGLPPLSDYAATTRPLDEFFTSTPDLRPFTVDPSGVLANPFVPLPGRRPASDPRHGIYSFTKPDATDTRITGAATWRQIKHTRPPGISAP